MHWTMFPILSPLAHMSRPTLTHLCHFNFNKTKMLRFWIMQKFCYEIAKLNRIFLSLNSFSFSCVKYIGRHRNGMWQLCKHNSSLHMLSSPQSTYLFMVILCVTKFHTKVFVQIYCNQSNENWTEKHWNEVWCRSN